MTPRPFRLFMSTLLAVVGVAAEAAKAPAVRVPSRAERLARVLALEDQRSAGQGELERLLRDIDRGVRRRAALAAGRVGDASLVPALGNLMNDTEAQVRLAAAFALGQIDEPAATDRLVASLSDPEVVVRTRAALALGQIGDRRVAPDVAQFTLKALPKGVGIVTVRGDDPGNPADPWAELRAGLLALGALKDPGAAESVLLAGGRPRFDWWVAVSVAARLQDPVLRPVLVQATTSNDSTSRALAARGLGDLKDPSAIQVLAPMTHDPSEAVAVAALRALGAMGDVRAVAPVAAALASRSDLVKREALLSLARLPSDPTLRAAVVPFVGSREPWLRGAALRALARSSRDEFALVLSGLDPDPDGSVRAELARALASQGDEMAVGILLGLIKDPDTRVKAAVLRGLVQCRGVDAAPTLVTYLGDDDPAVRAVAAETLGQLLLAGQTNALMASWRKGQADVAVDARLAIVAALTGDQAAASAEALRTIAQQDPERVVRLRAAAAAKARGMAVEAAGIEAPRPRLDYRAAMAPYDPNPGFSVFTPRAIVHTRAGVFEIHLDVIESPLTTATFIAAARRGYYDGTTIEEVEPGFLVRGGSARGDGVGGSGRPERSEPGLRAFARGAVGIAGAARDTDAGQFFVALATLPEFDGRATLFGWVASGMDVVERLRPGDRLIRIEIWSGRE